MITTTRRAESILPAHPHPQTALPAATLNFLGLPLVHPVAVAWMLIIRIDIRVTMREVVGDQERPDPNTKSSPMPPVKSKAVANRTKIVSTTIDKWLTFIRSSLSTDRSFVDESGCRLRPTKDSLAHSTCPVLLVAPMLGRHRMAGQVRCLQSVESSAAVERLLVGGYLQLQPAIPANAYVWPGVSFAGDR